MKRIISMSLVMILLLVASTIYADVIHFKSGRKMEGKIIEETKDKITLKTDYATLTFDRDGIASIERKKKKPKKEQPILDRLISLNFTDAPMSAIFGFLSHIIQRDVRYDGDIEKLGVITIRTQDISIKEALDKIARQKGLKYEIKKNSIIFTEKEVIEEAIEEKGEASEHVHRGFQYAIANKDKEAIQEYEKAIQIDPTYAPAYHGIGTVHFFNSDYEKAFPYYQKALEYNPDYGPSHKFLGLIYVDRKKYDEAIEEYHKAIKARPYDATPYGHLGDAYYFFKKDSDKALHFYVECLERGLDKQGHTPLHYRARIHTNLGNIYREKGRLEEATAEYNRAIELYPKYAQKARKHLEKLSAQKYFTSGIKFEKEKLFVKAEKEYKKVLKVIPDYVEAHYHLGIIYNLQEKYEKAKTSLGKAVKLDPKCPTGKAAKKLLQSIRDKEIRIESEKKARVLYVLAENYRINNLSEQALKEYEKVIGKYPQTSWAEKASQRIKEIKAE